MTKLFRWIFGGFVGLLAVAAIGTGLVYYLASRSLPDYNRSFEGLAVSAPVEILRDSYAVPHIFGQSNADVLFGLGFAHAQDRLWQMELMRRTAQGRLSELFGPETLETDTLMRALDLYAISQRAVAYQTPETLALLNAYAAGVNAWVSTVRQEALGRGAPEFFLYDNAIAPWSAADSIALIKLTALQTSDKASLETLRAKLSFRLPAERIADILPDAPKTPATKVPSFSTLFPDSRLQMATDLPLPAFYPLPPIGLAGASNAFAASGARSASGGTLMANDPHMGLSAPGVWMLARLELESGGVIGATIPGIPAILIGRNNDLSWGLTASYLDDQDLYLERLNPQNSDEYLTEDGAIPFKRRPTVIQVEGQAPVSRELRWASGRPVLPDNSFGIARIRPEGHEFSLAWTGLIEEDRSVQALIGLMSATSTTTGRAVLADMVAPANNITLADRENIAIVTAGRVPMRDRDNATKGRIPAQGWLEINAWQGYYPFEQNPFVENPDSGVVVNTNNALETGAFPANFSFDWGDTQRIIRATDLLNARQFHTQSSFVSIQTDTVSISARILLPLIGQGLWFADQDAATGTPRARRREALGLLAQWNGEMGQHDPEPLIYAAWVRALQGRLIRDDLGQLSSEVTRVNPLFIERVFRDINGASNWCNIGPSIEVETCRQIASIALDDALQELVRKYGSDINRWRWGSAHLAFQENKTLGRLPVVAWFANIWQETPGGDNTLLRGLTRSTGSAPYTNIHAAGFRMVVDFDNPDNSVYIAATGQSGHFLSRFYDDLSVIWRRAEYIPMTLDPDIARGAAAGITRLNPPN
ncbi:MAG: penicillin acylase family protein [Rhodobacteraceae bacterium]|nr:penicillin acylase family protein [Paracoccaceae bacterium]